MNYQSRGKTQHLCAVLRRTDGLFAVLCARQGAFERPIPPKDDDEPIERDRADCPYCEVAVPLSNVPVSAVPAKNRLIASWESLRKVRSVNLDVTTNILHVLMETVPDPIFDSGEITSPVPDGPPPARRPTAAHPRAYRGTKYKPPKSARPAPVDLRSSLCSISDEQLLLSSIDPFLDEAMAKLEHGPFSADLRHAPAQHDRRTCPSWLSSEYRNRIASLPADFRRNLLWNLRKSEWDVVAAALSAYWALGLERDPALMRCISIMFSMQPVRQMVDWCGAISRIPPPRRIDFVELLIESGAYTIQPDQDIVADLIRANELSGDAVYRHRIFYALCAVREKFRLNYAHDGFLLANRYYENFEFIEVAALDGVAEAVVPFMVYVYGPECRYSQSAMSLWKRCSELDGFKELLLKPEWKNLDPDSALEFSRILGNIVYEELSEKKLKDKWLYVRQQADFMLRIVIQAEPGYRAKVLDGLSHIIWVSEDAKELAAALEPFCRLLTRFCSPPFSERSHAIYPLTAFTGLPPDEWAVIENADDGPFLKLESETVRDNEASLISQGLWSMADLSPRLTAEGFAKHPRQVLKTARTLGALDVAMRREVIKSFASHTLSRTDESTLGVHDLVGLAEEQCGPGIANPVPRRLSDHLKGRKSLRATQIERDVSVIRDNWTALKLDVLNRSAFDRLSAGMPPAEQTAKVRHAFMIQQAAMKNRRSLRRMLKAHLDGQGNYSEQHPENRQWLAKHPKIDPGKWTRGITFRGEAAGHGVLDLSVEQDPLEVLRLGTYFGTCLGVGGALCYSAAAVTLDINKQVIYARNASGRVMARQLVAISEDDRLICFHVYPKRSGKEVLSLFREFDLRFAVHLGLEIFLTQTEDDDGYDIALTVSGEFWDDYAWDLEIGEEPDE